MVSLIVLIILYRKTFTQLSLSIWHKCSTIPKESSHFIYLFCGTFKTSVGKALLNMNISDHKISHGFLPDLIFYMPG